MGTPSVAILSCLGINKVATDGHSFDPCWILVVDASFDTKHLLYEGYP